MILAQVPAPAGEVIDRFNQGGLDEVTNQQCSLGTELVIVVIHVD